MERESFENHRIAELLNRDYISVKVDREERPDVDSVYMSVCQAMTGQGGWPLTIIMTPDCRPFFSGTYFPPKGRYGRIGMEELLTGVAQQWKGEREKLLGSAGQIEAFLKEQEKADVWSEPAMKVVHQAFRQFSGSFDRTNGGFGGAPKFPTPHNLLFLMEYGVREKSQEPLTMAETTLAQMYRGGIFDHIGGGFSRYSTDERWLAPHFEKMLYDNALLAIAYLKACELTGRTLYSHVARRILGYVDQELTDSKGGFYCGQDADSDGVEGKYYVFTPEEIADILGKERGEAFCRQYGITTQGNFEGKSIPNLLDNRAYGAVWGSQPQETVFKPGKNRGPRNRNREALFSGSMDEDIKKLYEYRRKRTRLHKDDKILVSWNGWMICACAMAGVVLESKKYVDMAVRAEAFIRKYLVKGQRLKVRYRDGDAAGEGKLDDYACYTMALLELYKATFDTDYLRRGAEWAEIMLEQFFDPERGGFYLYAKDGEQLIVRTKEAYDGAIPSGNSAAARVLQQLAQITGETKWQEALDTQLHYLAGAMSGYPSGHSFGLLTMMNVLYPSKELVCVLSPGYNGEEGEQLLAQLSLLTYREPGLSVVVKTQENKQELERLAPYTGSYAAPEDGALFYLCSGSRCMPPVQELNELLYSLEEEI